MLLELDSSSDKASYPLTSSPRNPSHIYEPQKPPQELPQVPVRQFVGDGFLGLRGFFSGGESHLIWLMKRLEVVFPGFFFCFQPSF